MRKTYLLLSSLLFCALFVTDAHAASQQGTVAPVPSQVIVPTSSKDKLGNTIEKSMAYVKTLQVKNGKLFVSLDYVQWFFGEAAVKAYRQDHPLEKEDYPMPYYIRNSSPKIRTFEISPKASFTLQTNSTQKDGNFHWNESVNTDTFKKFVLAKGIPYQIPFHIEVTNGIITKVTEQYVP
ncbi:hypothetical protein [Brevibacillus sp. DP1.3A]|uniref:hypothetical protein n=1 Tax=unclassified Brevibacillus TaxID=2684853 RepID=UPI00156B916C|nr:hypothetical protein [Brevibacillus sp. DP1.3A]MED1914533.1 hypothetical protein [Bacillus thuringiensis]UED74492.1 hypothetical protein HP399_027865 [Brevibacillus sp. DP1.3A]